MKRFFSFLLAAMMTAGGLWAETFESGGLHYAVTGASPATVKLVSNGVKDGSWNYTGALTVPTTVTNGGTTYAVTEVGDSAFYDCKEVTAINLPEGLTTIGSYAFANCSDKVGTLTMPSTVTTLKECAFSRCGFPTVVLNDAITVIPSSCFMWSSNVTTVKFPKNLQSIGVNCFWGSALARAELPASVNDIQSQAFARDYYLESISVDPANATYSSANGCLLSKDGTELITAPQAESVPTPQIPAGVKTLKYASLGYYNAYLVNLILPEGVETMEANAIYDGNRVQTLSFPSTMKTLEGNFAHLDNKYSVVNSIECKSMTPPKASPWITKVTSEVILKVPEGALAAYKADPVWGKFSFIEEVTSGNSGETPEEPGTKEFTMPTSFCPPAGATVWSYAPAADTPTKLVPQLEGTSTQHYWQHVPATLKGKYIIGTEWCGWIDENTGKPYTSYNNVNQISNIPCYVDSVHDGAGWTQLAMTYDHMGVSDYGSIIASFDKGVKVLDNGIWVGCGIDISDKNVKIPVWDIQDRPAESYIGERSKQNYDFSAERGPLAYKVYLVDEMPAESYNVAMFAPDTIAPVIAGQKFQIPVTLVNCGWHSMYSYKFTYKLNGRLYTGEGNCKTIYSGLHGEGMLSFAGIKTPGEYDIQVVLDRIGKNDVSNESEFNTFNIKVTVLSAEAPEVPQGALLASYGEDQVKLTSLSWSDSKNIEFATRITDKELQGLQVLGVKIPKMIEEGITNLKVWTSTDVKPSSRTNITTAYLRGDSVVAFFEKPINIPASGIYVGCSYTNVSTNYRCYPIWEGQEGIAGATYYKKETGENLIDSKAGGVIAMQVYLSGDVDKEAVKPVAQTGNLLFGTNKSFEIQTTIANYGSEPISSLDYTVSLGDLEKTGHADFSPAVPQTLLLNKTLKLPMDGMDLLGDVTGMLTIEKVNGKDNSYAAIPLNLKATFLAKMPVKRPLMEEGTGTTCGWCPRGMVALDLLHKKYGENFVAAAYHRYKTVDPMYNDAALPYGGGGFPSAAIDRGESIDPYYGASDSKPMGILDVYQAAADKAAPADIDLKTVYNEETQQLSVDADVEFAFIEKGASYTLGYIVTIDSLSHPEASEWRQTSYFTGKSEYKDEPYLSQLYDNSFDCNTFNHVVIECDNYKGVKNSIPATVKAGDVVKHHVDISLEDNELLEDPAQAHVVAILLDNNGKVVNSRLVGFNATTESGINDITEDTINGNVIYYDLMGRRVSQPGHGLYIRSNGNKAEKVVL